MTENGHNLGWSWLRIALAKMIMSQAMEMMMGIVIIFHTFVIIVETDNTARCYPEYTDNLSQCPYTLNLPSWLHIANWFLLWLYTVEFTTRIYVFRVSLFEEKWNRLDGAVVVLGWVGIIFDGMINISFLRLLRLSRLTRAFRVLRNVRELYLLIDGVVSTVRTLFFGCVFIFAMLTAFGILMVEFVYPSSNQIIFYDCDDCSYAFRSVGYSVITLFRELIAGGSWIMSLSLWEKDPVATTIVILTTACISLGFMNLILTVIVEKAAESRAKDVQEVSRRRTEMQAVARKELMKICKNIDTDVSGTLSMDELMGAYENSLECRVMLSSLDIQVTDLQAIFEIADNEGKGEVEYQMLIDTIFDLKSGDSSMLLATMRFNMQSSQQKLQEIGAQMQKLATQSDVFLRQIARLDTKIDGLKISSSGSAHQLAPSVTVQTCSGEDVPRPPAIFHLGTCSTPVQPCSEIGTEPSVDHDNKTDVDFLYADDMQPMIDADQWQQEIQMLLDVEAYLVSKAICHVDTSLSNVTDALHGLMSNTGEKYAEDMKTMEVWFAERKYKQYQLTFNMLSHTAVGQQHGQQDVMQIETEDRNLASAKKQLLSHLTNLLPQLLQLDGHAVPP